MYCINSKNNTIKNINNKMERVTITITQKETITIVLSLAKNGLIHHILRGLYHKITQTR